MSLGKQVKLYRKRLDLTLEQLEELSGVSVGTINALEVRDSVRSKYAPALAAAMGLTLEQLLDESQNCLATRNAQPRVKKGAVPEVPWPFKSISVSRYDQLTPKQKEAIEEWVDDQITRYTGNASDNKSTGRRARQSA